MRTEAKVRAAAAALGGLLLASGAQGGCNDGTGTVYPGNAFPSVADTGGTDCVIVH